MSRCQTCIHSIPIGVTSDIYTDGFEQVCCDCKTKVKDGYEPRYEITAGKCPIEARGDCPLRSKGRYIDLNLAKRVIAKFKGYLDEDMITRIQIALEKESRAEND